MICVDSNGQAIEISVADQMWLDDAYFKGKQMHLEADAPRVALAYRVCRDLCIRIVISWQMAAFGRKYNQSTIASSGDRRIKGGEIAMDRHYILLRG